MENRKINLLFVTSVLAFFAVLIILVKEFDSKRNSDFKQYSSIISKIVRQKNDKIRELAGQLSLKEKENADLKNTLSDARNALDTVSKKLAQPIAPAAPAAPAPATK